MNVPRLFRLALLGSSLLFELSPASVRAAASGQTIVLASTTSVENSGLLAHILPQFTKETGIEVHVIAQGTGQALDTARRASSTLPFSKVAASR